jgi:hypothetical protein
MIQERGGKTVGSEEWTVNSGWTDGHSAGFKWLLKWLHYLAEKAAQVVTKHAKRLHKWLHFVET